MMGQRFLGAVILCASVGAGLATGCKSADSEKSELIQHIDHSLEAAVEYMLDAQSPDGAWRSRTYGALKDGPSLTPLVLEALMFGPPQKGTQEACDKGATYLAGLAKPDGTIDAGPYGLNYPVYTATMTAIILTKGPYPRHEAARDAWVKLVLGRQLTEQLGWEPSDPEYGGWGFSLRPAVKPKPGQLKERFFESNLSSTIFAIGLLRSVKTPETAEALKKALIFVKRCQNFTDGERQSVFDDGGFFFVPDDPLQNKAGIAGTDPDGRVRFNSYGSMTADGIRGLIRCGMPLEDPRVRAAQKWLETNFTATTHPGKFESSREVLREATYYYYCWSLVHAMNALDIDEIETKEGKVRWAEALAGELIRRQRRNGSWVNHATDAREDDPLVSTPWAAAALAICRQRIAKTATKGV